MKIVILGSGVIGVANAYYLTQVATYTINETLHASTNSITFNSKPWAVTA